MLFSRVQGDQLYMAVCFWYLGMLLLFDLDDIRIRIHTLKLHNKILIQVIKNKPWIRIHAFLTSD